MRGRLAGALNSSLALLLLFAIAAAIRLALAHVSEGHWYDITLFRLWSNRLVEYGTYGFYSPTPEYVVDYPPGYLYVLFALGHVSRALLGGPPSTFLLKLPGVFADLGVALFAVLLARRVMRSHDAESVDVGGLAAAAILFNPGLVLISAVWGQVDSLLALLALGSVYLLAGRPTLGREAGAVALLAFAVVTKPQVVFALPIVAVVLLRRHLRDGIAAVARLTGLAAVGLTIVFSVFIPFGVNPSGVLAFYRNAGSMYPFTSLSAFNVWGVFGFFRPDVGFQALNVGGASAFYVGLGLTAVAVVAIAWRCWLSLSSGAGTEATLLFGITAVTCVAFTLLTRTHERYLYLAITTLAPLIANHRLRWAFIVLTVCYFLNVHYVYVFQSHNSQPPGAAWTIQPVYDLIFGSTQNSVQLKVWSMVTAGACLTMAAVGWDWTGGCARNTSASADVVAEPVKFTRVSA